jgi:hypothetical protein
MQKTYVTIKETNYPQICPECAGEITPGDTYFEIPVLFPAGMLCKDCTFNAKETAIRVMCEDCVVQFERTA